jgi:hypothetical protein
LYRAAGPYIWHFPAVPTTPSNVRYPGKTGRHMLIARFSHFDPKRTCVPDPFGD